MNTVGQNYFPEDLFHLFAGFEVLVNQSIKIIGRSKVQWIRWVKTNQAK